MWFLWNFTQEFFLIQWMWVKIAKKTTLRETFDEAIKVENEMLRLITNSESGEKNDCHPKKKEN